MRSSIEVNCEKTMNLCLETSLERIVRRCRILVDERMVESSAASSEDARESSTSESLSVSAEESPERAES